MVPLLAAIPIGSMLAWKRGDLPGVLGRLKAALVLAGLVAVALIVWQGGSGILAAGAMALAAWLVAGALIELAGRLQLHGLDLGRSWQRARGLPRSSYGMTLAHVGVGVLVAGVTASSAWQSEAILIMRPGDSAALAGYDFTLAGIADHRGPNYVAQRATFEVSRDGRPVAVLTPEKRFYPVERQPTSEAGIDSGLLRRSLRRAGRSGRGRGRRRGRPHGAHLPQPAGGLDLGRRADHGPRRAALAVRPAPSRRRPGAGPAARSGSARRRAPDERTAPALPAAGAGVRRRRHRPRARADARPERAALGAARQAGAGVRAAAARRAAGPPGSAARTCSAAARCWSTSSPPGACPAAPSTRC